MFPHPMNRVGKEKQAGHAQFSQNVTSMIFLGAGKDDAFAFSRNLSNLRSNIPRPRRKARSDNILPVYSKVRDCAPKNVLPKLANDHFGFGKFWHKMEFWFPGHEG